MDAFVTYLKNNQLKAIVTEFGAGNDATSCKQPLTDFVQYLKDNAVGDKDYGFVGWTAWSTGHGWGDSYNLLVTPSSYQWGVLGGFLNAPASAHQKHLVSTKVQN